MIGSVPQQRNNMLIEVTQFNKERNKLELNQMLEANMLAEEIKEFWDAVTIAERLDALVDTEYVWMGTKVKYSFNNITLPRDLEDGVHQSLNLMEAYLQEELGEHFWTCLQAARKIVCQANELKGMEKDKDGKVLKDKAYKEAIDATKTIALMIEAETKPRDY